MNPALLETVPERGVCNASSIQGKLGVTGALTDEASAQSVAETLQAPVFHNPTHGAIADFTEAALQKFTGTSAVDRQLIGILKQITTNVTLVGHSQGGLSISNALLGLSLQGGKLPAGSKIQLFGSAASKWRASFSAKLAGAKLTDFITKGLDPIAAVQPSMNPMHLVTGIVGGALTGAKEHDFQKYYAQLARA